MFIPQYKVDQLDRLIKQLDLDQDDSVDVLIHKYNRLKELTKELWNILKKESGYNQ